MPVAALSMAYLWRDLKGLKLPVLVYVLLLCFFISRGLATFYLPLFGTVQAVLITGAASMFFIGDLELAVSSFKKPISL